MTSDLFDSFPIKSWLPNESFFSLCSRYHQISGHRLGSTTCQRLFGHSYLGSQHDFPAKTNDFVANTNGALGSAKSIILNHTILPYYLPFQDSIVSNDALSTLCNGSVGSIKYRLGLLTSRFRANHPLKACLICIEQDCEQFLTPYWHLDHQLPGAWICKHHSQLLLESTIKSNGINRFQWALPDEQNLATPLIDANSKMSSELMGILSCFSISAMALHQSPHYFHFEPARMKSVIANKLYQLGLCSEKGRYRRKEIARGYLDYVRPLSAIREFQTLPVNLDESEAQILPLLYFSRRKTHPIRLLTLILWLFKTWDEFLTQYNKKNSGSKKNNAVQTLPSNTIQSDERRNALLHLVMEEQISITSAARSMNIAPSTALVWAAQKHIKIIKKPKKITDEILERIIFDLLNNVEKKVVAKTHSISITTINRILRSDPALNNSYKTSQYTAKRDQYRSLWRLALLNYEKHGVKAVRQAASSTFAWLYRNDNSWLTESCKKIPLMRQGNYSSVNWAQRDLHLSNQVRRIYCEILEANQNACITAQELLIHEPELRAKLSALNKLPLTRKAIRECTNKNHEQNKTLL